MTTDRRRLRFASASTARVRQIRQRPHRHQRPARHPPGRHSPGQVRHLPEEIDLRQEVAGRYTHCPAARRRDAACPAGVFRRGPNIPFWPGMKPPGGAPWRCKTATIPAAIYYPRPLHLQTAFTSWVTPGAFPVSEDAANASSASPCIPTWRPRIRALRRRPEGIVIIPKTTRSDSYKREGTIATISIAPLESPTVPEIFAGTQEAAGMIFLSTEARKDSSCQGSAGHRALPPPVA